VIENLKLLVFDFDGVLTDNRVIVHQDGTEAVVCNRADGLALDVFRQKGIPTLILSTETNPVVGARAKKLQIPVLQSVTDKGEAIFEYCSEIAIALDGVMFVGNDLNDLSAMERVKYPVAVADAHPRVKSIAWRVLRTRGGSGVAREIAEDILRVL